MNSENELRNEHQRNDFSVELERKFADCVPVDIYELAKSQHRSHGGAVISANSPNVIYRATIKLKG
jgi:hypothetical protein